ncbi:hypothetical protein [Sutterella wadsworthensis]|uniref:hypothetical protein n=1 Tax=Sutterella wadsworthensis TaxID=40545 RepID=UPI0032C07770
MQDDVFDKVMEIGLNKKFISNEGLVEENLEDILKNISKEDLITILKEIYEEFIY